MESAKSALFFGRCCTGQTCKINGRPSGSFHARLPPIFVLTYQFCHAFAVIYSDIVSHTYFPWQSDWCRVFDRMTETEVLQIPALLLFRRTSNQAAGVLPSALAYRPVVCVARNVPYELLRSGYRWKPTALLVWLNRPASFCFERSGHFYWPPLARRQKTDTRSTKYCQIVTCPRCSKNINLVEGKAWKSLRFWVFLARD